MADTAVTTGNELTSNPGNAALGYSEGVQYNANPAIENPLSTFDNTLARIQEQEYKDRVQKHLEQREDMKRLGETLAQTDGSLFNMKDAQGNNISFKALPQDAQELLEGAHEERRLAINNPGGYQWDEKYLDARERNKQLKNNASIRAAHYTQQQLLASTDQDDDVRKARLEHLDDQMSSKLSDFKMITPFTEPAKFVDKLAPWHTDKKNWETIGVKSISQNGEDFDQTLKGIPTAEIYSPLREPSELKNAVLAKNLFEKSPLAQSPQYIIAMNAEIDRNAAARGTKPYHAAEVTPDGRIVFNPSPAEALVAHNLASHGGVEIAEQKPSKSKLEAENIRSQIIARRNETAIKWAEQKHKEEKDAKGDTDTEEEIHNTVQSILKFKQDIASEKGKSLNDIVSNPLVGTDAKMFAAFNASSINPSGATIVPIKADDQLVTHMAGIQREVDGKLEKTSEKPIAAFYRHANTGNPLDDRIVVEYKKPVPQYDLKGKREFIYENAYKAMTLPEAASNHIYSHRNYEDKDKDNRTDATAAKTSDRVLKALSGGSTGPAEQSATPTFTALPNYQKKYPNFREQVGKNGAVRYVAPDGGIYVNENGDLVKVK